MCSLKRWSAPFKKTKKKGGGRERCLLAASLLVCFIAWTELSTNETAHHVHPERKPPSRLISPTWQARPLDLSCSLSIPSLGLSSLKAMCFSHINFSCFPHYLLSFQLFHMSPLIVSVVSCPPHASENLE